MKTLRIETRRWHQTAIVPPPTPMVPRVTYRNIYLTYETLQHGPAALDKLRSLDVTTPPLISGSFCTEFINDNTRFVYRG